MRWEEHIVCIRKGEVHTGSWWEDISEGDHFEYPRVYERIILKLIYMKLNVLHGLDRSDLRQGQVAGFVIWTWNRNMKSGNFLQ